MELIVILNYLFVAGTIHSLKIIGTEKEEVNNLNEKLQIANIKLRLYALKVEELTASKESATMAQELHV